MVVHLTACHDRSIEVESLRSDGRRLWDSLMAMAKIGATSAGGSCRLALTDEDKAGRDLFVGWCEAAGCSILVDDMGNIFARRPGRRDDLPPIATGSHLDTQPHGGKFDGVYGVLAGLEVVRALNDQGIETEAPIEVVVWTNEEGSRFAPAMVSSGVYAGLFTRDYALSRTDSEGLTLGAELARIGYLGSEICGSHTLGALFEAHIEQGPILERNETTIGVVQGGQGQRWYDLVVLGQDAHSGSTPMAGRRDALVAAAAMTLVVRRVAEAHPPHAVATVGSLSVHPDSRNTIPGEVRFTVDLRHPDDGVLTQMGEAFRAGCQEAAETEGVALDIDEIWHNPPVVFDASCVSAVRQAAEGLGLKHQDIVSGAGHDACQVCRVAPTAMIFVPCAGGLSHNEAESATPEDLKAGCDVLIHAMLAKAGTAA
ncbi:MAG: Zn-dependent hydrolase [Pseudomonadota bacterium]